MIFFSPPQFLRKPRSPRKLREEGRRTHGLQAGGIRIIILRQLFFHWDGPVPRKFERYDVFAQSSLWGNLLSGLSLRRIGGKVIRKVLSRRA